MEHGSNLQKVPGTVAEYAPLYKHGFTRIGFVLGFSLLAVAGGFVGEMLHELVFAVWGRPVMPPFFLEKKLWMVVGISIAWTIGGWWGVWDLFVDVFMKLREGDPKFREQDLGIVSFVYAIQFVILFVPVALSVYFALVMWDTIVIKSVFWMTECERYVKGLLLY